MELVLQWFDFQVSREFRERNKVAESGVVTMPWYDDEGDRRRDPTNSNNIIKLVSGHVRMEHVPSGARGLVCPRLSLSFRCKWVKHILCVDYAFNVHHKHN